MVSRFSASIIAGVPGAVNRLDEAAISLHLFMLCFIAIFAFSGYTKVHISMY